MPELKKGVNFWVIFALAIASIMGTGLFFGAAIGSRYAGNLVILSWIFLSIVALYIAACFGELVALFPKTGGVYEFGKQAYGRFMSFIIGWAAWLVSSFTVVLLIVAAINYLLPADVVLLKLGIGILFILALNLIAYFGLEASSLTLLAFTAITVVVLTSVIVKGFFFFDIKNLTPFFSHHPSSIILALFFIVESFFGWEAVTFLSEETVNPRRVIPKALITATAFVALMGLLIYLVSLGIIPWQQLSKSATPLADISNILFRDIGSSLITLGIYLSLLGSAAAGIITTPRLIMALARDRLFLGQFKEVHEKFKSPHKAIIFQTIVLIILLFLGFGNYKTLLSLLVPMGLFMYSASMLAVAILRFKQPDLPRYFKVAFGKIGPLLLVMFFFFVLVFWLMSEPDAGRLFMLSASIVAFGLPLYLLVELYYDPKMITSVNDLLAFLSYFSERFTLPKRMTNELFTLLSDIKGKSVLDFGCSVGTLTVPLARAVGKRGFVYAVDFSNNAIKLNRRRVRIKQWEQPELYGEVKFIHDQENMTRVHPDIKEVEVIVSLGRLSYMQDLKKVLKELADVLHEKGKICFIEYGDFFHVIPNIEWMAHDKTIEHLFREAGFAVRVLRKKGLFWNYIFIYGAKLGSEVAYI